MDSMIERRVSLRNDPAFVLASLYTCGFLGMVFVVLLRGVPAESANVTQQLISIMSLIQGAIGGYYYGASKAAERAAASPSAQTGAVTTDTVNVAATTANVTGETK